MTFLVGRDLYDAHVETFTGNASTTAFTLANSTTTNACVVRINGVVQRNGTDFTVSGTTITFTTPPPNASNNVVVQYFGVGTLQIPTDGSVTNVKMADDAIGIAELSATGTPSSSTFLRGDNAWAGTITLGTQVATTSGTSIDFTSIPSGTKKITVNLVGVSSNGSSVICVQIGDSGGVEASGYTAAGTTAANSSIAAQTASFPISQNNSASAVYHGSYTLNLENSSAFTWIWSGQSIRSDGPYWTQGCGSKSLSAELDRVRLTTVGGSDTFDAGVVNISYQ